MGCGASGSVCGGALKSMCGICGKLIFGQSASVSPALVKAMADRIQHRGPDDEGYYTSGPVGLGFRRLSIIDLKSGHQPLSNEDGSIWITFNGEIYNYQELRKYLLTKGHVFKTDTDTEVIVHLYEELGEGCVEKLRGMFAFAIWDDRQQVLFLARDRVGIKPLYYYLSEKELLFASEIKAILADPVVKPEVLPAMIDRFLTFKYLAGNETLFKNIQKLAPGSYMIVRRNKVEVKQYWDLSFEENSTLSLPAAAAQLSDLLEETVRLHMISDVPVGFLLSGGVDSTALLSIATGMTDRKLSSFTVGFSEPGVVDERPYARLAAQQFGTEHHEITITAKDFEHFLPHYVWHMEEPVCEPPAVAMYYISRVAMESVKVLISGEGGDEAFGGYQVYRNLLWLERLKSALGPLKGAASSSLLGLNQFLKSPTLTKYAPLLGIPPQASYYGGHSNAFGDLTRPVNSLYTQSLRDSIDQEFSLAGLKEYTKHAPTDDRLNRMLYIDTKTWLAHDLLLKADKMTMANSIELRVPFLDHKVLEFAASLPGNYKVRGLTTKYIAKKMFGRRIPQEIIKRKKVGFPVPYESWLRRDLKDWIYGILLDRRTLERGYFEKQSVERLLAQNSRSGSFAKDLFSLVTLELWHRAFLEPPSTTSIEGRFVSSSHMAS
jgi:asparagine synthase (glutamine-hydrolysing)